MNNTSIDWANMVWNPITGCTEISPGCGDETGGGCYAKTMALRLRGRHGYPADDPFKVTLRPERLGEPLEVKASKMIFVNSMSDLFHEDVPFDFIDKVFDTMLAGTQHIYQVLTKRTRRMRDYIGYLYGNSVVPGNIWLGTSIESRDYLWRLNVLKEIKAETKFLSIEPLIGAIGEALFIGISQVIIGGESGAKARPMELDWARDVIRQCRRDGVPVFFKQLGRVLALQYGLESYKGNDFSEYPEALQDLAIREFPVASSGETNGDVVIKAVEVIHATGT